MKILSLCSSDVNARLKMEVQLIDTLYIEHIISDIYDRTSLHNEGIKLDSFRDINYIERDYDYIIIDLLFVKLKEDKCSIYLELINLIINDIVDKYHISKIILLNLNIDEEFKIDNERLVKLTENEKLCIRNKNRLIKKLYENVHKNNPGLSSSKPIKIYSSITESEYKIKEYILDKINFNQNIFHKEKMHKSLKNIRYYFEGAKIFNKNKLIIVFSAFSKDKPKYNYINTLKCIDCNKLYILDDYGEKGCYYLGLDGNFDIETSVMSLVSKIMKENHITFENVITIGTSKGGSAAIYYGFKYNFREVIVGAPQYKIGTYLTDLSIKTYGQDIFGNLSEANRVKYDSLIRKVICENSETKLSILTSEGDNQYKRLLKDIEFILLKKNINFTIDKCNINHHNEISKVFTSYVYEKLMYSLNKKGYISNKLIKFDIWRKIYEQRKNN